MTAAHWTSREALIVVPPRRDDVVVQELDDELVFCDPRSGATYHLNRTAHLVWQSCDGTTTTRRIAEMLTADYDVDFDTALDDVEQIVVFLAQADLIGASP